MKKILKVVCICLFFMSFSLQAQEVLRTHVSGVPPEVLQNINTRLKVLVDSYDNKLTVNTIQEFYNRAPELIQEAIKPYGYFKAQIHKNLTQQNHSWDATFVITPGPVLPIKTVDFRLEGPGKFNPALQKFARDFPLKPGQEFVSARYEEAKQALFQIANNEGYIKSYFAKKEVRMDLKNYFADIYLHFNTGERYYFGKINFRQSSDTFDPVFLQKLIEFRSDQPFSQEALLKSQQDLGSSQYFEKVAITPQIDQAQDNKVPVDIELVPRKGQQYNVGLGYGTLTGPRLSLGADFRHVTRNGQHFNMQLKLSPILSGLAAKYFIPGNDPLTEQYTLGTNIQRFVPKNGFSNSQSFSASYIKNYHGWQNTFSLNYLLERYRINTENTHISKILYPSYILSRTKSDDAINPHNASALSLTLQGSSEHLFSTTSFLQSELKGKYLFSPTDLSRVILRGDLGYTVVHDVEKLPLSLQFFAGGLNSIRAYPYAQFGPGRYLKVGSIEFQHQVVENWFAAIFYDAGMADNHFHAPLNKADGVGVIYNSFIGPIKLYAARAETTPGKPWRIVFDIGPDF